MKICKNCRYIRKSDNSLAHIKEFSQGKYVVYYVLPDSESPDKVHHCSYVDFPGLFNECEPIVNVESKNQRNREDVMSYNIGDSNYAQKAIQPWDVWEEYTLNPWDADIVKRTLREKESQSRREDYEKIKHICDKRISQIDAGIKMYGEDMPVNPVICSNCVTAFSDKFNFCPECGEKNVN